MSYLQHSGELLIREAWLLAGCLCIAIVSVIVTSAQTFAGVTVGSSNLTMGNFNSVVLSL